MGTSHSHSVWRQTGAMANVMLGFALQLGRGTEHTDRMVAMRAERHNGTDYRHSDDYNLVYVCVHSLSTRRTGHDARRSPASIKKTH
jgi:hypothetical protein